MIMNTNKGYTLLFAVIVSSIVLSVAAFILSVSRKQFILSSAARDSTLAIYAADSGIQCAVKAYSAPGYATSSGATVICNGEARIFNFGALTSNAETASLGFSGGVNIAYFPSLPIGTGCALITIYDGYESDNSHKTVIVSRGYNIGDATTCPAIHPREEERAIRLVYHD